MPLFGQEEGRDLWQSRWLFWHLLVQAVMVGSGALAVAGLFAGLDDSGWSLIAAAFVAATAGHLVMLVVEYGGEHATAQARVAAHVVVRGRYARTFWFVGVLPVVVALVLGGLAWVWDLSGAGGVLLALGGLLVQPALTACESGGPVLAAELGVEYHLPPEDCGGVSSRSRTGP